MNAPVIDQGILVNLLNDINSGWPNLYSATLEDHELTVQLANNAMRKVYVKNGKLNIRYIPERTKSPRHIHLVSVVLDGELTWRAYTPFVDVKNPYLKVSIIENSGNFMSPTDNITQATAAILETRLKDLQEWVPHLDKFDKLFPITWKTFSIPEDSHGYQQSIQTVGTTEIRSSDFTADQIGDIGELAKVLVGGLCPAESPMGRDDYLEFAKLGYIDDCYIDVDKGI